MHSFDRAVIVFSLFWLAFLCGARHTVGRPNGENKEKTVFAVSRATANASTTTSTNYNQFRMSKLISSCLSILSSPRYILNVRGAESSEWVAWRESEAEGINGRREKKKRKALAVFLSCHAWRWLHDQDNGVDSSFMNRWILGTKKTLNICRHI